jgi:hypothetical protein
MIELLANHAATGSSPPSAPSSAVARLMDLKHLQVAQNMLRLPEGKRPRRRAAKQQHLRMILLLKSCFAQLQASSQ